MRSFCIFVFCWLAASVVIAADTPSPVVITDTKEGSFNVTTSIRTNGCTLVLKRYAKAHPALQGYWVQTAYAGGMPILIIVHSLVDKEQTLKFEHNTPYGVIQIDQGLDGRYGMFAVVTLTNQSLMDLLIVTKEGWLRHGTEKEFQARQQIGEQNKEDLKNVIKVVNEAIQKANIGLDEKNTDQKTERTKGNQ